MKESSSLAFQSDGTATEPRVFELSVSTSSHETIVEKLLHFRINVGDAVSDEQFTHIAARFFPPQKDGFSFACFSEGCIVLNVPAQSIDDWYPVGEWISRRRPARRCLFLVGLHAAERDVAVRKRRVVVWLTGRRGSDGLRRPDARPRLWIRHEPNGNSPDRRPA